MRFYLGSLNSCAPGFRGGSSAAGNGFSCFDVRGVLPAEHLALTPAVSPPAAELFLQDGDCFIRVFQRDHGFTL